jgi:hypothetical protein
MNNGLYAFSAFEDSRLQRLAKVLSYSGTSGALTQEALDRQIEMLVNYKNVVRMNIPRVGGDSDAYKVVQRTAGSTPAEFVAETGDFVDSEGSYAKASFSFKTMGGRGKITRFAQATGRSFGNVMANEIEGRMEDFRDKEEYWILYANSNTTNQFKGFHQLIDTTQHVGITTAAANAALTLKKMDELWDQTRLNPDLALTSQKGLRIINALLQSVQRFNDKTKVNGGFLVSSYNDTPILKSSNVLDTMTWSGSSVSAITGGAASVIYTLTKAKCFIAELTPLQLMMLARTTSQWERYDVFEDIAPVVKNKYHAALLSGFAS